MGYWATTSLCHSYSVTHLPPCKLVSPLWQVSAMLLKLQPQWCLGSCTAVGRQLPGSVLGFSGKNTGWAAVSSLNA